MRLAAGPSRQSGKSASRRGSTLDAGKKGSPRALKPAGTPRGETPLHRAIYEQLLQEIQNGTYREGDRLPSEAVLCERFSASRITVAKAIGTLQREQLVRRRAGSGTFVQQPSTAGTAMRFGLLIPDLGGTEIFEPICRGMMTSPLARAHSLTWGHTTGEADRPEKAAEDLCRQFIAEKLTGVFFAPLEHSADRYAANHRIVDALERAGIAVVLLDRCVEPFPFRSKFDLVGIDNHRAGAMMTKHMLDSGATRPVFVSRTRAAPTVYARASGYRTTMMNAGLPYTGAVYRGDLDDPHFLGGMMDAERPDALVCANDSTAATIMRFLLNRGLSVPGDVRISGVDDVKYAQFLPVALTTIRQNCAEMGRLAMATMLNRLQQPQRPARDLLVDFLLVVRESSGAAAAE